MSALTARRSADRPGPGFIAAADAAWLLAWRLFTSVNFAVLQIIVLALLAVVGMTIRQLPGFAFRSAGDYASAMADIHDRYDAAFGTAVVDLMERLQLFHVFTSTWFTIGMIVLVVSILICTIDRTPRLWRTAAEIRVVQPEAFFDPRLPDRARIAAGADLRSDRLREVLRRHRFSVRTATVDGVEYLYGDRNRWTKLATLLTHLGLILFLVAGAVTSRLGDEQGLVVAEGETLTVQPIGTPGLLLVQNNGFEAPGLFETGSAADFVTDLSVYQDGRLIARKSIRVNDPLAAGGYTFHQNGFGPAPLLRITDDADGSVLWSGPVPLTDAAGGLPFGTLAVPGRDLGLQLLLDRTSAGTGTLVLLPYVVAGTNADGSQRIETGFPLQVTNGASADFEPLGFTATLEGFNEYTLLIAKKDPGQGIVWAAFGCLIVGLAITFYLPRRRVWGRRTPDGEVSLVGRSDRYVDFDREFGRLLDDLVAARAADAPGAPPPDA